MNNLNSIGKSIIISGAAAGIISLVPLINILNIFFMAWMGFGGALSIYLFRKENKDPKTSEVLLCGSMSGLFGSTIFGSLTYFAIANISPEKLEQFLVLARQFSPGAGEEVSRLISGDNFQSAFLLVIIIAIFFSIITATLGAIIANNILNRKQNE